MQSVVGWFLQNVVGIRPRQETPEVRGPVQTSTKGNSASKNSKTKQKVKKYEDPKLATNLTTPIEDVIEDGIKEVKTKLSTSRKKRKSKSPVTEQPDSSHSKKCVKPSESVKSEPTIKKKISNKPKVDISQINKSEDESSVDNVGFSLLPVKEKGKSTKKKSIQETKQYKDTLSTVIEQNLRKTKENLSKPLVIDHFKKKDTKQAPSEAIPVASKTFVNILEKVQNFPVITSPEKRLDLEDRIKTELKESKKVCSSISYASIVTNNIPETTDSIKIEEAVAEKVEESGEFIDNLASITPVTGVDLKIINQPTNKSVVEAANGSVNVDTETEVGSVLNASKSDHVDTCSISGDVCSENIRSTTASDNNVEKDLDDSLENPSPRSNLETSKSNSSSFEVILKHIETQFDSIKESLNNLVESTSESDDFNDSQTSSIFIVDNLTESEENKKDTFSINNGSSFIEEYSSIRCKDCPTGSSSLEESFTVLSNDSDESGLIVNETEAIKSTAQEVHSNAESTFQFTKDNLFDSIAQESPPEYFAEETAHSDTEDVYMFDHQTNEEILKINGTSLTEVAKNPNQIYNNLLDVQLLGRHLEVNEQPHLTTEEPNFNRTGTTRQNILLRDSDYLQEQSSALIEEEKCVKKSSYITTNPSVEAEVSQKVPEENKQLEMASSQVRVLTLNNQEHQECTLYRIEKNWALQFRLGPSLFGRKVYLYCNYPVQNKEFHREQYQLLTWIMDEGCKNADDTAAYTQVTAKLAGSFHYYFTFDNRCDAERQGSGFFLVDPVLKYGKDEDLPLDCVQCQTVLAKGLGSFSTWQKKLQVAKESGYNMIHFTPIQELGVSNSSYSLSEQLKLNPVFKKENGEMPTFAEIKQFIAKIREDWKVTSICDIVLNHTANESEWIKAHPEVTYNCVNCAYMRPAYLLDAAFHQFSMDVKKGLYEDKGIPIEVNHEDHLNAIRYHFRTSVIEPLKIQELYICDTSKLAAEFFSLARVTPPVTRNLNVDQEELKIIQDEEYKRLAGTVDMKLALKLYNVYRNDTFDEDSRLKRCTEEFKSKLDSLNNSIIEEVNENITHAIENVLAGIRYFRVQSDGPRVKEITIKNPLVYRYFTDYGTPKNLQEHEDVMYSSNGRFLMAHNGWVMNSDPLKNFASPDSNVYIRRELIAWGDSVKLRYGDKPEDCPFLWEYMQKYVEQTAEIFDGVRLDNCHSTPIPVAEYLLDCARRVRPDLYVVAELFTNSDMTDNIFVNRLGITSLIREAMSAWDSHEEGRLVYRYGGSPVGSFYQPRIRPLVPSVAHALFLDLTHDNPSPVEKRSVFDLLPSTALVNMACCASGSNRGYDELVPHHIHVVDETRQYTEWTDDENLAMGNLRYVTKRSGIIPAKRAINDLHFTLGKEGYNQVYVDQMDPDIVAVTRHRPDTHESYILVAFTAFGHPNEDAGSYQKGVKPLRFEGVLDEIVLEATLSHVSEKTGGSKFAKWKNFVTDPKWVNGLSEYQVTLKQHIQANDSDIFEKVNSGSPNVTQLNFKNFKPGSVVVVKASLPESMRDAIKTVRSLIGQFSLTKETELSRIIEKLTLSDLNRIIYRCGQEERDEGFGFDTYHIPGFGSLVYAGLQGFISVLANIRPNNDLGHPVCGNLRDGNWMIEYIWKRLKLDIGTREIGQWIEENTKCFNRIPRYLVPSYFDVIITGIYVLLMEHCYKLMSKFVNHGSTFVRGLSLGSVQFAGYIKSADLPVLSPTLAPPKPPTRINDKGETIQACVTLSAGLPHFAVGYMRNWGRDTFIALRGLFILTGRFQEAREHILGYGACLRHGLIPNLLDGGRNSRFNCRDAVWWWLYCIKEYVEEAPNGINILSDEVSRIFPMDDSPAQPPGAVNQPLYDVMQEALRVHFQGLSFRERNAGRQIDEHMTDRGFNNQIGVHPETGFVFGGNEWNCGTWMDKMGSSDKAGNRGKPATPRDGSAVELIGLSKAVITWLWKLSQEQKYPYNGVERTYKNGSVTKWTFNDWSNKIQANFEKYFWINTTPVPGEFRPDLINKRGIYKDCYGASQEWTDFQLRCNFPIALVVAPELFTPQQAWTALKQAEQYLLGPLGMKTLDPDDWAYRGDYDNSNDSNDPTVAHGFNYHQGPEWVWPVGFFLRAKLHFASLNGALNETLAGTKLILSKHFTELQSSVWRGLPELTNSNGSYCNDSSRTQAWSMSCILEVLHDLQKIESKQPALIN